MEASDTQLLEAALRGDAEAFEMVIRTYSRPLFAVAFAILHDRGEAEDVVQETFVKAYRSRWRVRRAEKFPAWLTSIARNRALDVLRRRKRTQGPQADSHTRQPMPEPVASTPDPAKDAATDETHELLHETLAELPETHRIALTMRYLEGMDHRAIEQAMGVSNGALRGILGRALGTMRKALKPSLTATE